ncbi:hypothetical protein [Oceanithermus sp.]
MVVGVVLVALGLLLWLAPGWGLNPGVFAKLWPILLVALGLDLLLRGRRRGRLLAAALTLGLLVLALAALPWASSRSLHTTAVQLAAPAGVREVALALEPKVAWLELTGGGAAALAGEIELLPGQQLVRQEKHRGNRLELRLTTRGRSIHWRGDAPRWQLALDPRLTYRLELELAVGGARIDLRGLDCPELELELGVGRAVLYPPDRPGNYKVKGGVGELVVYLPPTVPVVLELRQGFGSVEVAGLEGGPRVWERGSGPPLRLTVTGGVGRVRVLPTQP